MIVIQDRGSSYARIVLLLTVFIAFVNTLPNTIKIGALFGDGEEEQELMFRYAVDSINSDSTILPRTKLEARVEKVSHDDSFRADKKVCGLLKDGVAAIIGPTSSVTSMHVQSICDALDIPHLETRCNTEVRDEVSRNLHPKPSVLARAFIDLVEFLGWKKFSVVYEENDGLVRLQEFLKQAKTKDRELEVQFYRFTPGRPYRDTYWEIKKSGETNIVLDVKTENMNIALKHAQQVGLITENHNYIITSLDLHTIDLEDYKFSKAKITSFRLTDVASTELITLREKWPQLMHKYSQYRSKLEHYHEIKTDSALIYDAVKLLALALQDLDPGLAMDGSLPSCESKSGWKHGDSWLNYMRSVSFRGITGQVQFDPSAYRSIFTLSLMTIIPKRDDAESSGQSLGDGLQKIGTWYSDESRAGPALDVNEEGKRVLFETGDMKNKTYRIVTILTEPYAMLKSTSRQKSENDRYEGYVIDLAEELSKILGFKYVFHEVGDGAYGRLNRTSGKWDGMIAEVINDKADMAIADLTINSEREAAVDFSHPFMNTGISILFRKPDKKVTTLFSFLSPFSMVVWVYVVGAYVGVSVILFVVGRLSPYEWDNPHPCRQDDQVLENDFSLLNSFWFTIGSLMQQGSDLAPKSMSTRTIAGIWYFFTLIMISSYTANLAAFLTVEKPLYPIEDAKDLAAQTEIKYGCVATGSTKAFFEKTTVPVYRKMYEFMEANPYVYQMKNEYGKKRVLEGGYAFLMESASIEFLIERECNLTQIGGLLDNKGYGIATKPGSDLAPKLSEGILKLQERGVLQTLKDRWWKQKRGGGACTEEKKGSNVTELSLGNVGGVFVVLVAGLFLAFATAVCEFCWRARKMARNRRSMCEEMMRDLKFALSCQSSTKVARNSIRFAGYVGPANQMSEKPPGPGFIASY